MHLLQSLEFWLSFFKYFSIQSHSLSPLYCQMRLQLFPLFKSQPDFLL